MNLSKSGYILKMVNEAKKNKKASMTLADIFANTARVIDGPLKQDRTIRVQKSRATVGMKSLRFDAEARGNKLYPVTMIFYGVSFSPHKDTYHPIPVKLPNGKGSFAEKLDVNTHAVRIFCGCPSFQYRSEWYLKLANALVPARKARPYTKKPGSSRPSVNPEGLPCCCKHIYQMALELQNRGVITNV